MRDALLMAAARRRGGVAPKATWDPLNKSATMTLSEGNLLATKNVDQQTGGVFTTSFKTAGKFYMEFAARSAVRGAPNVIAIVTPASNVNAIPGMTTAGALVNHDVIYTTGAFAAPSGIFVGYSGPTNEQQYMLAMDLDNRRAWVGRAGVWLFGGNPATNTAPTITWTGHAGSVSPAAWAYFYGDYVRLNAGQFAFVYAVPSGFTGGWPA